MRDDERQVRLIRLKKLASGLLLLLALLLAGSLHWLHASPWLGYLAAFSQAALIGGLADWFAVTALFRHPLGLPIPHTAIIPANKDRVSRNIARFLQDNFTTREVLQDELARADFVGAAARWLEAPGNAALLARQLVQLLPPLLVLAGDEEAERFLRRLLSGSLDQVRLAPMLARVLRALVAGGQHHVLMQRLLGLVSRAFEQNLPQIRQKLHENSPRWLPRAVDDTFFERLIQVVESFLIELQDTDGPWRERFEAALDELIDQLATSERYESQLREMAAASLARQEVQGWLLQWWRRARTAVVEDVAAPDSVVAARLGAVLYRCGRALAADGAGRDAINRWLREATVAAMAARRDMVGALVERVIAAWDAQTIARKFELHVGSDLQFIRFNGTLVGGLIGLLLFALGQL